MNSILEELDVATAGLKSNNNQEIEVFLDLWDKHYKSDIQNIALFNPSLTAAWSQAQKAYFIKIFYHARGYFKDFLWHMGNFAPNKKIKDIILANIGEEFGENALSHEQIYIDFAKSEKVDLADEILYKDNYLPEIREFNYAHLVWLSQHDSQSGFAAFSAYERLDNVDYEFLAKVIEPEHKFFTIHKEVEHFDNTLSELKVIWDVNSEKVKEAFAFIAKVQTVMWQSLSDAVFNYEENF